jgi:hypothetical protein
MSVVTPLVRITCFPERIFLERGIFEQSVNFELRLQNDSDQVVVLDEVSAEGFSKQDRLLFRFAINGREMVPLMEWFHPSKKIEPGKMLEIFNPFASFPLDYPLHKLHYELEFRTKEDGHIRSGISVNPVIYEQKAVLSLPFNGMCLVTDGHDFLSHHRRLLLTDPFFQQMGITANDTRFGYDFVLVDDELRMFTNTPQRNEDFFCWGKPVYCPGDGRVAQMFDGLPDNPLYQPPAFDPEAHIKDPKTSEERHGGNYVMIDHGNNEFSEVAHMQKGSVQVNAGDKVVKGELIGQIGSSGDSIFPHIDYHLQKGRDSLKSEGLPSRFERFDLIIGYTARRIESSCPNTGMIIRHEQ